MLRFGADRWLGMVFGRIFMMNVEKACLMAISPPFQPRFTLDRSVSDIGWMSTGFTTRARRPSCINPTHDRELLHPARKIMHDRIESVLRLPILQQLSEFKRWHVFDHLQWMIRKAITIVFNAYLSDSNEYCLWLLSFKNLAYSKLYELVNSVARVSWRRRADFAIWKLPK